MTEIKYSKSPLLNISSITLFYDDSATKLDLERPQINFIKKELDATKDCILLQELGLMHFYIPVKREALTGETSEKLRRIGNRILGQLNAMRIAEVVINS